MIRPLIVSAALVLASAGCAFAASGFDGPWSVVIVTKKGECDAAYRNTLTIEGGNISYAGGPVAEAGVVGSISKAGQVKIAFKNDQGSLNATGRMAGSTGSGVWNASNGCAGTWKAEKRG
jgi:hypothetical protein